MLGEACILRNLVVIIGGKITFSLIQERKGVLERCFFDMTHLSFLLQCITHSYMRMCLSTCV